MAYKEIHMEKPLPFGWTLCQYWPGEIILKHPSRKRGIYIKAPWYRHTDQKRWEGADGKFYRERRISPINEYGFRSMSITSWPFARRYTRSFTYHTSNGTAQTAVATSYRERTREVAWGLRWLPFAGKHVDGIRIEFSEEMGNQRGSWKGGVIGTSCTMQPGESVEDAVDRHLAEVQASQRWDR